VGITGRQGDYLESLSLTCADARTMREQAGSLDDAKPEAPEVPEEPTP